MKYIFKQIDNVSGRNAETTSEFSAVSLNDILDQFQMFLRGSGFYPSGVLDFVDEDACEPEWYNEEFDVSPEESTISNTQSDPEWHPNWPFPRGSSTEEVNELSEESYNFAPSVGMQWTVNELMKGPMTVQSIAEECSICGINLDTMKYQTCWNIKCAIGNDAY